MSPFRNNLQKFLVYFFSIVSVVLIVSGIIRAKKNSLSTTALDLPVQGDQTQATNKTTPQSGSITISGTPYQTPWGDTVASITVANGKITGVTVPTVPNSPPSQYAEPYLVQQALAAGSANIQGVSGATYTSLAFKSSLESAISKAASQGQTVTPMTHSSASSATPTSRPSVPRRYSDDD